MYNLFLPQYFDTSMSFQTFVIDASQDLAIPQTFLLSEPARAKHIRIYPTPFDNTSAPCIRFELLGCRKSGTNLIHNVEFY